MNFNTQLKTWAASLGLVACVLTSTESQGQVIQEFDSIAPHAPSGHLLDKSPSWYLSDSTSFSPSLHDGTQDTGLTFSSYRKINAILYESSADTLSYPIHPDSILEYYYDAAYGFNPNTVLQVSNFDSSYSPPTKINDVVLGIIDQNVNKLDYSATADGSLYFNSIDSLYYLNSNSNVTITDTIQIGNHPDSIFYIDTTFNQTLLNSVQRSLQTVNIFSIAVFDDYVFLEDLQQTIRFNIPPLLSIISNQIEIDFDDGLGYRPLDSLHFVNYNSFGTKTVRIRRPKLFGDGYSVSKSKFRLIHLPYGTPDLTTPFGFGTLPCNISLPIQSGKGWASFILQDSINKTVKKPFVIVEGFDRGPREHLSHITRDPANPFGFGFFNYASFTSGAFGERAPQVSASKTFIGDLLEEGYDVVFVDFLTNGDMIESNGLALVDFLSNVLQPLLNASNSTSQVPIVGVSMGGLIVRSALLMYEQANCCHNINMYATFSTPHRGANIPLSLQHAFNELGHGKMATKNKGRTPARVYDLEISCPAAQQMLVSHIRPGAQVVRQNFEMLMNTAGQPKEVLRVGLTNGSATAQPHLKKDGTILNEGDEVFSGLRSEAGISVSSPINYSYNAYTMRIKGYADSTLTAPNQTQKILERGPNLMQNILSIINHTVLVSGAIVGLYALISSNIFLAPLTTVIWSIGFLPFLINDATDRNDYFMNYTQQDKYQSGSHIALDNVPGDYVLNFRALEKESEGYIQAKTSMHSFVSTVSALDIDTSNYWSNVQQIWLNNLNNNSIPFDHIWYPGVSEGANSENQAHVRIDQDNIDWIINVLRVLEEDPSRYNGNSGSIGTAFNFGQPQNIASVAPLNFIGDVSVQPGAILSVNKSGQLYQGGFGIVMDSTHFVLKTANVNCETPIIRNLPGGTIAVGDVNGENTADLVIRKGATLELDGNSTLKVFEGSRVIIEEGATLAIGVNTSIELVGQTSQLVIRGKVIIEDHADFTFTGNGEIVYDVNDQVDYNERWEYGPNSTMTLNGNGTGDVVLRVEQGVFQLKHQFNFANAFGGLTVTNGDVILANSSLMSIASPLTLDNVTIDHDGANLHSGLHLWGQQNVSISNSKFLNGTSGIRANLTSFGNSLSIQNSEFENCETGIWLHGKAFRIEDSKFVNNTNYGIYAEDMEGQSLLSNSEIRNNIDGVYFQGQEGTKLRVETSDIRQNTRGIDSYDCSIELQCNNISANNHIGLLSTRGRVFMNNDAGNVIVNNGQVNLFLYECYELRLENGMNNFLNMANSSPQSSVSGCFNSNATGITVLSTGPSVSMTGNLPTAASSVAGIALNYCSGTPVAALLSNSYTNLGCAPTNNTGGSTPIYNHPHKMLSDILNSTSSNTVLTTANIQNELLNDALDNSLFLLKPTSDGGDILLALDRMDDILTYPYTALSPDEEEILSMTFKMMVEGYGMALDEGLIAKNRGLENTNENPYLQKINNYLSAAIQDVDPNDPNAYEKLFELKLDQAHVYRMTEHYDYALNALSNAEFYADAEAILRSDYWDCVCTAEDELLAGLIEPEEFNTDVENCKSLLEGSNKSFEELMFEQSQTVSQDIGFVQLTPNPTSISSLLEWTPLPVSGQIVISDINGNTIRSQKIKAGESSFRLFKEDLVEGVYFIRIEIGSQSQSIKWVVI